MLAALRRTFALTDRYTMDFSLEATNPLNRVTYTLWNTTVGSPQFGLPAAANAMRALRLGATGRF